MNKKPRADSQLKTLQEERQSAIADHARAHTLAETVAWLREDGIKTSSAALSLFLSWHSLRRQLARNESTVETLISDLCREMPDAAPEKIQAIGQSFFSALALEQQDAKIWVATQRLQLDRESALTRGRFEKEKIELRKQAEARSQEKLRFEREKWIQESCRKIIVAATDARAKEISEMEISNAEKIALVRKTYFADVDELEKSGEVQLPE